MTGKCTAISPMSPIWCAGIRLLVDTPPVRPETPEDIAEGDSLSPVAPFRVVNIGNGAKVRLMDFIIAIEAECGRAAVKNFLPMQPGDVPATWADASLLKSLTGYAPQTPFREGVARFVAWVPGLLPGLAGAPIRAGRLRAASAKAARPRPAVRSAVPRSSRSM